MTIWPPVGAGLRRSFGHVAKQREVSMFTHWVAAGELSQMALSLETVTVDEPGELTTLQTPVPELLERSPRTSVLSISSEATKFA